jgi:hypothetical protein
MEYDGFTLKNIVTSPWESTGAVTPLVAEHGDDPAAVRLHLRPGRLEFICLLRRRTQVDLFYGLAEKIVRPGPHRTQNEVCIAFVR